MFTISDAKKRERKLTFFYLYGIIDIINAFLECDRMENETRDDILSMGLSAEEVKERIERGEVNVSNEKNGKSYGEIIFTNLFTFFNLVWAIISVILCILGEFKNLTFLPVIIPNILIAIILECRAKATVEKLSVTTDPRVRVVRDGAIVEIMASEIVLDDLMLVESGQQILSDGVAVSGIAEANESMLTGEQDAIRKEEGAEVLAGSYLVSGAIYVKVKRVGRDNYIHTIEKAAKSFKKPTSNLFRDLEKLLRYIAIFMVPMAALMLWTNYIATDGNWHNAILKTCGSVIGMIPAGVYLLVTVTLTLSVIKLARKRTVVQDMYSIEMLAAADVVCLDKTGTITDGTMCVTDTVVLGEYTDEQIHAVIARIEGAEGSLNATSRALVEAFGQDSSVEVVDRIPFSSARKHSAVAFADGKVYSIGAPHFVPCPVDGEMENTISLFAEEGKRVLVIAEHPALGEEGVPIALVAIADRIRPNAKEVIANFQEQGVTIKIISGDHAHTVSSIARRVGVRNAERYLSCENITPEELERCAEDYAVFGRVTPEQKVLLVKKLRSLGHTVAMTGDGVNDTLALKESNCAIAMADGSEMARKVSQIVLLDSDFATLPDVVREGRRCINNVRMSASLFLMKTILTIFLSIYAVCTVSLYPFSPSSMLIIEFAIIGIASVLLALEPNNKRIEGSFIKTVILRAVPSAIGMIIPVMALLLLERFVGFGADVDTSLAVRNALAMLAMTVAGYVNLVMICIPYTKWRLGVVLSMGVLSLAVFFGATFLLGDMLLVGCLVGHGVAVTLSIVGAIVCALVAQIVAILVRRYRRKNSVMSETDKSR